MLDKALTGHVPLRDSSCVSPLLHRRIIGMESTGLTISVNEEGATRMRDFYLAGDPTQYKRAVQTSSGKLVMERAIETKAGPLLQIF